MKRVLWFLLLSATSLSAAESADISLKDGRVLKGARIVSIGEKQVAIIHAGGMTGVPPELLPLDVLARAHMMLEAKVAEQKKKDDALRIEAAKRIDAAREKHDDEVRIRLAEASVRDNPAIADPSQIRPDADAMLLALKGRFPPKRRETVMVQIDDRRDGPRKAIEIEIPAADLWSYYHGMVQTTTAQGLPATLGRIHQRIKSDLAALEKKGARADHASRAQASKSAAWIVGDLIPFVSELGALRVH